MSLIQRIWKWRFVEYMDTSFELTIFFRVNFIRIISVVQGDLFLSKQQSLIKVPF